MANEYKIGNIVRGKVSGIEKYGIFVKFPDDYNGLVHISEISSFFVRDIHDYVQIGDYIYCQILDKNESNKQLKLSIKNINYRDDLGKDNLKETRKGFLPLKENLDIWIKEKLKEYK